MKVLALALALSFASVPLAAAAKKQKPQKIHHAKSPKVKNNSHVKHAGKIKHAKPNRVN